MRLLLAAVLALSLAACRREVIPPAALEAAAKLDTRAVYYEAPPIVITAPPATRVPSIAAR